MKKHPTSLPQTLRALGLLVAVIAAGCTSEPPPAPSQPTEAAEPAEPGAPSPEAAPAKPVAPATATVPAGATATVTAQGTKFEPPITPEQIPPGAWMCEMGTVHYASTDKGDGKCPLCGMALTQKAPGAPPATGAPDGHDEHAHH